MVQVAKLPCPPPTTLMINYLPFALFCLAVSAKTLHSRAAALGNVVSIDNADSFCMIMPRAPHTNIGDSEKPGGTKTYCSAAAKRSPQQGELPADFWSNIELRKGKGKHGKKYAQLTGCIRPRTVDRLNPEDSGGQYDSSGGADSGGNPHGSICIGYNHYVELVEPAGSRACIKCCDDPDDCLLDKDTQGCPNVISGNYFNCT